MPYSWACCRASAASLPSRATLRKKSPLRIDWSDERTEPRWMRDRARRAVHRAADVGRALRGRDAAHGPQLVDGGLERFAVDVLHRVVVDAVLLADGEHGHDVRVMELGGRLGFVAEAGDLPLVEHRGEGQHLERDAAIERLLVGLVDDAHAAAADLADDLVVADLLGGRLGRLFAAQRAHRCAGRAWRRAACRGCRDRAAARRRGRDARRETRRDRAPRPVRGRRDSARESPPARGAARRFA